jgi:uncharacterized protein YcaQ
MPLLPSLSADQARRIAVRSQGFDGAAGTRRSPTGVLLHLGALQLDTISVLARSHELVCYSRIGAVGRMAVEEACWGRDRLGVARAVEYWAHAACVLPTSTWPWLAFRRRAYQGHTGWWREAPEEVMAAVLDRIRIEGPLTASDLGGAKQGGPWWDWSPRKVAVEHLLAEGRVVCVTRTGWKRVYDLPERALPEKVLAAGEPSDADCFRWLVSEAGRCLGVATKADLADYYRLRLDKVEAAIRDTALVEVQVEGWGQRAWADPSALALLDRRAANRVTLLSPFDSLIWDRKRTARIFGFEHRLEAYTPAPKRIHGYYVMPLLAGGKLVGRVDPARSGQTLVAKQVSLASVSALQSMARALTEAATWVGCSGVEVQGMSPAPLKTALVDLLR